MMNNIISWKQAETLSPGQLALNGIELATKSWQEFVKFVLVVIAGFFGILILAGVWNGLHLPLGGVLSFLALTLFALAAMVGAVRLALSVVDGKKLTLKEIFSFDGKTVGNLILAYICFVLAVMVGMLALVVPGILLAIGCSYFLFVLVDKPGVGPVQALKASWAIANGDLLNIVLVSYAGMFMLYILLLPVYEIGVLLLGFARVLKSMDLDLLIILPGLAGLAVGVAVIVGLILLAIGNVLAMTMAYRKLSQHRASAMEVAMKS
jgi:hypothetical protein